MTLPLDLVPMEAQPVEALPTGAPWVFEPKWDGFRALAFRDGKTVHLQSRRQKPLGRYFPEMIAALAEVPEPHFVLDGELLIPGQAFETLQLRLHPSAKRVAMLAETHPARFVAFDLLENAREKSLLDIEFAERRRQLEAFFKRIGAHERVMLSPVARSAGLARRRWFGRLGHDLDGIVAKRLDLPYRSGQRAMQKFKLWRTIDCVVGGLYMDPARTRVDSVLLGLYDTEGRLNYVGRSRVGTGGVAMADRLRPLIGGKGFNGARKAGGKSRWSNREHTAVPLKPRLVAEVSADHITGDHFRHGARILRWRDDKAPERCTMDQLSR